MLEGLATWVLNTYLGQYLENLNTDQLSIGLLQGEVELENLPLRKDALAHLDFPVEVKAGFLGRIRLKIPVRRLRSEPWVISIEKLYVVIGPIEQSQTDTASEEVAERERKLLHLDALEASWRANHEAKQEESYYASSYSSWFSYGTSLVANIVENLQLNIKDVHIRYEETVMNTCQSFAWGITIESLSAQSANNEWVPSFVMRDDGSDFTRKLLELKNFAIYWDSQVDLIGHPPLAELESLMMQFRISGHQYILDPVCAQAKLLQNCCASPLRSKSSPRFICNLQLDNFPINLNEVQYREYSTWIKEFERINLAKNFKKWRPPCDVRGHAKEWWQFAIHCHLEKIHNTYRGRNWKFALCRARNIVAYVEAYKHHLANPVTLTSTFKTCKESVECELGFDELKVLREIAMQKLQKHDKEKELRSGIDKGQGLLQGWFPLWSGWYSRTSDQENVCSENPPQTIADKQSELEEEILDVLKDTIENNTLLKRDVVFAQLNFELKNSSLSLEKQLNDSLKMGSIVPKKVFKLEFANVQMCLESRPRTNSWKFHIRLGGLFLHDQMTMKSIFPLLVAPHSKNTTSFKSFFGSPSAEISSSIKPQNDPLFELNYEGKPFGSTADHKLHICCQSLDLVYNPEAIRVIVEFFTLVPHRLGSHISRASELKLTAAAKLRYEKLKHQTKLELMKNWDQIIEGEQKFNEKWDILFDISAPQILIPENLTDNNTTLVIFDFGRFQFTNSCSKIQPKLETQSTESDDDDFKTPCSSPPDELDTLSGSSVVNSLPDTIQKDSLLSSTEITEVLLHQRMYDKYRLELCNLQVLVVKAKDNWKFARMRGTSHMHILDRFSINLQFERRTVLTSDPQWPTATLSGSLPMLSIHVNEMKIQALHHCLVNLSGHILQSSLNSGQISMTSLSSEGGININPSFSIADLQLLSEGNIEVSNDLKQEVQAESRLFIMQFSLDEMSLAVESRGRSIAELQVIGVKAAFTKRPFDTSLALTVHGLLLVDAMQTYGPDFELLLASHKHVSIDSTSGRICDSEGPSPSSPASPSSPKTSVSSPIAINAALSNLQSLTFFSSDRAISPPMLSGSPQSPFLSNKLAMLPPLETNDSEALISVELIIINPDCPANENTGESLRIATVQFNNLDVVANQETLTELMGFIQSILPTKDDSDTSHDKVVLEASLQEDGREMSPITSRSEITFDFHHLSLMLPRVINVDSVPSAKKVAIATMSEARICATLGSSLTVEGSLGGLQVLNLTPDGKVHRRVLNLGHDPLSEKQVDLLTRLQTELYHSSYENEIDDISSKRAFCFTVEHNYMVNKTCDVPSHIDVSLQIASVCYVHSTSFLNELALCVTEFQAYMTNFASTIKSAATEVAMDIVNRGTDALSSSLYVGIQDSMTNQALMFPIPPDGVNNAAMEKGNLFNENVQVRLEICMETPIIVIPRTSTGSEVLVGQLGQITIRNKHDLGCVTSSPLRGGSPDGLSMIVERINIEIRDMNLYTMFVKNKPSPKIAKAGKKSFPASQILHECYTEVSEAQPVLHETTIELTIDRLEHRNSVKNPSHLILFLGDDLFPEHRQTMEPHQALQTTCRIVVPLKVSLSRQQYQQILETFNTLTTVDDEKVDISGRTLSDVLESQEDAHQSTFSTLKHDDFHKPYAESRSNSSETGKKAFMPIFVNFEVPAFSLELKGNTPNEDHGLVLLSFKDFIVNYKKTDPFIANLHVSLQTLLVEDLLKTPGSKHRNLMMSVSPVRKASQGAKMRSNFLSTSCPDITEHEPLLFAHQSLPDKLETPNFFSSFHKHKEKYLYGKRTTCLQNVTTSADSYPCTPPPSPSEEWASSEFLANDTLVQLNVKLVDSKVPDFAKKYSSVHRHVDVDFNCLETTVNLQSWVTILDFFGDNGSASASTSHSPYSLSRQSSIPDIKLNSRSPDHKEIINSEIQLDVCGLTLILNTDNYELAKANVSAITASISTKDENLSIEGKLGYISFHDLTSHGHLYTERFSTTGKEALDFQYFRYGSLESRHLHDYDMRLKIQMSSVRYIHTHRFHTEIMKFFHRFNQLQSLAAHFRSTKGTHNINAKPQRSSRILLDIQADSPVICIPQSSSSKSLLVIDLGRLTVTNTFLLAGAEGTISKCYYRNAFSDTSERFLGSPATWSGFMGNSYGSAKNEPRANSKEFSKSSTSPIDQVKGPWKGQSELKGHSQIDDPFHDSPIHLCLLDVMYIDLVDMDLYSAERIEANERQPKHVPTRFDFATFSVKTQGQPVFKQKCELKLQVEMNLDSDISHDVPDMSVRGLLSAVHCSLDVEQYKLVRGLFTFNLGESMDDLDKEILEITSSHYNFPTNVSGNIWMCTSFNIELENVTLELLQSHADLPAQPEISLAKMDFIKSKFIYESYSHSFKDIDLVSHEILISDTRFRDAPVNARPNVFTNILQPTSRSSQNALQAEFHYRATKDFIRFTVLLNNMRLMTIFDWWASVKNFIWTLPDNPEKSSDVPAKPSKKWTYSSYHPSPLSVSTGILTKRAAVIDKEEIPSEVKINITDTEIIVVEDASVWDTNAVILKSTAVITYRPMNLEKPLSCSLQSLEVFSCILGVEDDTALSIIDPVTVNIEINGKNKPSYSGGLLDATTTELYHVLEVSMHNLNVRLSYHDIQMFLQIIDSLPRQAIGSNFHAGDNRLWPANCPAAKISKLEDLGFEKSDCIKAYEACKGNLNDAALWLTSHAIIDSAMMPKHVGRALNNDDSTSNIDLGGIEVRVSCFCLCLIDDCKDADVPLVEMTLAGFYVEQLLDFDKDGKAHFQISSDYYNRNLSGWEPLMEPWKCSSKWTITPMSNGKRQNLQLNARAEGAVNINITSALIDLCKSVTANWTEDYYCLNKNRPNFLEEQGLAILTSSSTYRRRSPFVPFALKNDTGSTLWFTTLTTTPNKLAILENNPAAMKEESFAWIEVRTGETTPFIFEGRGKLRHRDTHDLKVHQLLVRVDGWQLVAPVSVDKVGIYFRHAKPQVSRTASIYTEIPPARIVFAVSLQGSAQKLITVRSALLLKNRLEEMVELKLENTAIHLGASRFLNVPPNTTVPIPLSSVHNQIWVRPVERWSVSYCNTPLIWQNVHGTDRSPLDVTCPAIGGRELLSSYRFCVCIKRQNFPPDRLMATSAAMRSRPGVSGTSQPVYIHPGHVITLVPPAVMANLLPYDLRYEIVRTHFRGCIRPGKEATLHMIDLNEATELKLSFENFLKCDSLLIQPHNANYMFPLQAYDSIGRVVTLRVKVLSRLGGALKILISAPYWLVNKSGLPLIFRQEGSQHDAAGQFKEHEMARSVAPLLFSFADREALQMCIMRVGSSVHPKSHPNWCTRFHLEKGVRVRRLRISPYDSRPDWIYIIGLDVRVGKGRYRDTHIVILSTRFQLDNRTTHQLEFAQKYATSFHANHLSHLVSTPKCTLPFHWPRLDLDQLLCVRQKDIVDCHWSGGFPIEKIDSFHINMRDTNGKPHFLRVEIILQGATYFVIFTDADKIPPPFRINNFSQVPVTYYQLNVTEERLKTVIRPNSSVPYAWDEPTLRSSIVCCAPGGNNATYDMNVFGDGKQLTYENFIFIAFTVTFRSELDVFDPMNQDCQELVLDVPEGTRVILSRKEPGKRTQLWRMTSTGMLQHEGSSPPRDPRKSGSRYSNQFYVLDIAGLALQPDNYVPLMIRKPDERRRSVQTWRFLDDGRLCCDLHNMYVQAVDGYQGLRAGNDVVLGPTQCVTYALTDKGIPAEQDISRQRLWPGSGMLTIKIVPEGPTRVLQIFDIRQKILLSQSSAQSDWVVISETKLNIPSEDEKAQEAKNKMLEFHVGIKLSDGLGISIVNKIPEELIYVALSNIVLEYSNTIAGVMMDGSVENIQIDSQLFDAEIPVLLYVTPSAKHDKYRHLPALHFTAHKMPSDNLNAHIFKHLMITMKNLTIQLEERLLWKMLQFFGYNQSDEELEQLEDNDFDTRSRAANAIISASTSRFYFANLKLMLNQVRLSIFTASRLPPDLQVVKHKVGIPLIKFEDAQVELDPFVRVHPFETRQFLVDSILNHYKEELKGQAAKILGAVDFLGNPFGLVNDVSEGLSGFISDGNIGGLVKNVTHGLSNSAAKVTGSLSDGLGLVTMDEKHEEHRQKIWKDHRKGSGDQLVAGLMGLGYGLMGGMTSIFTQTYKGAASEGLPGFFSGLGKGLVGTVAKPAVGVLDFATGAAGAVRDTSRSSIHNIPPQVRSTRLCVGPGGLLCRYSKQLSLGQSKLYQMNKKDYSELFIAYEQLRFNQEDLRALVSSKRVIFLSKDDPVRQKTEFIVDLGDLYHCKMYKLEERGIVQHYLELTVKASHRDGSMITHENRQKRPMVLCDSESVTQKVAQQINYAKSLYEEMKHTLLDSDSDSDIEN